MQIHVVNPGQTLYEIGRSYGIAPGFLARYNGLREPYRLAVGQALLILRPEATVTVAPGDTLFSIAQRAGISALELLRMNPNLGGQARLYPGQTLVTALEQARSRPIEVNGYAYPYVSVPVLRGILPFSSDLTPFTYGFTAQGELVMMDDEPLIALARSYGVRPLMHLSTLTESGSFSADRAAQVFSDPQAEQALIDNVVQQMLLRGYGGVDVDFEFLGAELAQSYAAFIGRLRAAVNAAGGELIAALAPKVSPEQPGVLYEGHDYAAIAANADAVLLMTYACGRFAHRRRSKKRELTYRQFARSMIAAARAMRGRNRRGAQLSFLSSSFTLENSAVSCRNSVMPSLRRSEDRSPNSRDACSTIFACVQPSGKHEISSAGGMPTRAASSSIVSARMFALPFA